MFQVPFDYSSMLAHSLPCSPLRGTLHTIQCVGKGTWPRNVRKRRGTALLEESHDHRPHFPRLGALVSDQEAGKGIPKWMQSKSEGRPVAVRTSMTRMGNHQPTGKPGDRHERLMKQEPGTVSWSQAGGMGAEARARPSGWTTWIIALRIREPLQTKGRRWEEVRLFFPTGENVSPLPFCLGGRQNKRKCFNHSVWDLDILKHKIINYKSNKKL